MWLTSLCGKPPPPSSMPAMYTAPPPAISPVICTSRMKVPVLLTVTGLCHVAPLSLEKVTTRAPLILKSFHETYMRPKKGEDGLLSAQPDSRSSPEPPL